MFIFLPINTSLFSHFSHLLHLAPTLLPSHRFSTPSLAFLGISQLSPNYQKPQEPKVGRKSKRPPPSPFKVKGSTFSLQPAVVVLFCMFLCIFCNFYIFFLYISVCQEHFILRITSFSCIQKQLSFLHSNMLLIMYCFSKSMISHVVDVTFSLILSYFVHD